MILFLEDGLYQHTCCGAGAIVQTWRKTYILASPDHIYFESDPTSKYKKDANQHSFVLLGYLVISLVQKVVQQDVVTRWDVSQQAFLNICYDTFCKFDIPSHACRRKWFPFFLADITTASRLGYISSQLNHTMFLHGRPWPVGYSSQLRVDTGAIRDMVWCDKVHLMLLLKSFKIVPSKDRSVAESWRPTSWQSRRARGSLVAALKMSWTCPHRSCVAIGHERRVFGWLPTKCFIERGCTMGSETWLWNRCLNSDLAMPIGQSKHPCPYH